MIISETCRMKGNMYHHCPPAKRRHGNEKREKADAVSAFSPVANV